MQHCTSWFNVGLMSSKAWSLNLRCRLNLVQIEPDKKDRKFSVCIMFPSNMHNRCLCVLFLNTHCGIIFAIWVLFILWNKLFLFKLSVCTEFGILFEVLIKKSWKFTEPSGGNFQKTNMATMADLVKDFSSFSRSYWEKLLILKGGHVNNQTNL